ncbi:MAG TPA: 1-acyl-sn-glycerol-3-phosphate acyltransferase, partial [Pelobium sp.]|nr:1-acyl-sn-glycerol-3-phosphate acyltransferase [Pelobium sp.]
MVYRIFYYLIKFTCYFYFKKVRIYNQENLNNKNPLIICANHGNSFMDAILIAINTKKKLHFLVRADVFNTPFKRWFFRQLNMMPIYRIRDGREAIKKNDNVFLKCRKILQNNGAVVIFPEGNCVVEKRLRTFKTGFVHLAFNTPLQNLQVLPIAINYSQPDEFYTDASLHFLAPIALEDLKILTQNQEFDFNKILMQRTHDALKAQMVCIPYKTYDDFFENVLKLKRNSMVLDDQSFITNQIETAESLHQLGLKNPDLFERIKSDVSNYFNHLNKTEIDDQTVASKPISVLKIGWLFPFYFSGYLLNIIPSNFLENMVNTKIKERQFKSSVRMVLSLFFYTIYILSVSYLLNFAFCNYLFSITITAGLLYIYYASFYSYNIFKQQQTP